jgi:hypothetical protein
VEGGGAGRVLRDEATQQTTLWDNIGRTFAVTTAVTDRRWVPPRMGASPARACRSWVIRDVAARSMGLLNPNTEHSTCGESRDGVPTLSPLRPTEGLARAYNSLMGYTNSPIGYANPDAVAQRAGSGFLNRAISGISA